MSTTIIGTIALDYDEETGEETVSVSYTADFLEFDVYARLYYVDRAVDELLLSTDDPLEDEENEDEDESEDEDEEDEWDEEHLA